MVNLIKYHENLDLRSSGGKKYVYDIIRKKDIVLIPEELVRQCAVHYLLDKIKVSKSLLKVEKGIKLNKLSRRCDIIVYDRNATPLLIVECKNPKVVLNQKVFNQIAMYNMPLQVPYLMVTNGESSYFCEIDFENHSYKFIEELPLYHEMLNQNSNK